MFDNLTDEEIVLNAQSGNELALDEIFSRYKELVNRISRSFFLIGGDLEDILQEGMMGLYKAIRNYKTDRDATFKTFASLCIRRQIQSAIRKASSLKNKALSEAIPLIPDFDDSDSDDIYIIIPSLASPESELISKENIKELKNAIRQKLSNFELRVLSCYLKGFSYEEIAKNTNSTKKSVDNALTRIKSKLSDFKDGL